MGIPRRLAGPEDGTGRVEERHGRGQVDPLEANQKWIRLPEPGVDPLTRTKVHPIGRTRRGSYTAGCDTLLVKDAVTTIVT